MSDDGLRRYPASHRLLVHPAAGRSARHVSSLTGASDWRRAVIDAAGAATIGLVGTRVLPHAERWAWPESLEPVPHPLGMTELTGVLRRR